MTPQFRDWIDKARAINVAAILHMRHIELRGQHGRLAGPCPLCGGTDRFAVDVGKELFNCRGCGGSGHGAISLVRFLDGSGFLQAVEAITGEPPPKDQAAKGPRKPKAVRGTFVCAYSYTDELGDELYQVVRYGEPKSFSQRRPDPGNAGTWIENLHGVTLVPYRLPDLIEAIASERTVFYFEGEKDADNAAAIGIAATTTAMGLAGKAHWTHGRYDQFFRDADVVIVPDQDANPNKGLALAHAIGARLSDHIASRVRMLALPAKDFTDWLADGGTRELFDQLADAAPDFATGGDAGQANGNGHDAEWSAQEAPQASYYGPGRQQSPPLPPILSKAAFLERYGKPPNYLIDDVLQLGFIYAITGQTGHAKTAVALLLARLVASSEPNAMLGRHKVGKGRVLYLVGENPDDVSMRIKGSDAIRADNPAADNIAFIPGIFDITQMMSVIAADATANGPATLIIVDTSAAYFLGNEELSNTQMGGYARVLRRLTTLPGHPCVLVLCHPIKHVTEPSQLLPRGGSAYLAEMDGNLTLWRTSDDIVVLDHTKLRGTAFPPLSFQLVPVKTRTLVDAKGRPIATIEAVAISAKEEDAAENRDTDEEDRVLATMLKQPEGSFTIWATDLGWVDGKGEPYKKRVERIIVRLGHSKPKLVNKMRKRWVLTEEGKTQARQASLRLLRETEAAKQPTML